MNSVVSAVLVLAGLCLVGCSSQGPTKEQLRVAEMDCLRSYCASNAPAAKAALLQVLSAAHACQEAGVEGIDYNEVFARSYGRLYLLDRHLGHAEDAELHLQKYAQFHAAVGALVRQTNRPSADIERLISEKVDHGLKVAWKAP